MREAFAVSLLTLCLIFQCSGSPKVTRKSLSTTSTRDVPVTTPPLVSLLEIFKNDSNSTPNKAVAGNHSAENLFVTLKDRIHSYRNPNKPYNINHTGNLLLTLKDKIHRYINMNKGTDNNQSPESPIVSHKNKNEDTSTAPQFSDSPFVTFIYEDYHSKSREMPKQRNSTTALMKTLSYYLQQIQQFDFQNAINEYVENHIDF